MWLVTRMWGLWLVVGLTAWFSVWFSIWHVHENSVPGLWKWFFARNSKEDTAGTIVKDLGFQLVMSGCRNTYMMTNFGSRMSGLCLSDQHGTSVIRAGQKMKMIKPDLIGRRPRSKWVGKAGAKTFCLVFIFLWRRKWNLELHSTFTQSAIELKSLPMIESR